MGAAPVDFQFNCSGCDVVEQGVELVIEQPPNVFEFRLKFVSVEIDVSHCLFN